MKSHVDRHNNMILNPKEAPNGENICKCQDKTQCPNQDICEQTAVVYQGDIAYNGKIKTYYGLTENKFKTRYSGHKNSLKYCENRNKTELSKHAWGIADRVSGPSRLPSEPSITALECLEEGVFDLNWSIKARGVPFKPGAKHCDLCLVEKTTIALAETKSTLNSRSELLYACKHKPKYLLARVKSKK